MPVSATPVSVTWWVGFHAGVFALLAMDLLVLRRGGGEVRLRAAWGWSIFWFLLALAFGGAIAAGWVGNYSVASRHESALQYFTGYFMEQSLSLDNVFVFALLFRHFRVPAAHQHRVLFWGVLGAMGLRLSMVLGGIALARRFEWVMYGFGLFLLWSAWRMWGHRKNPAEPEENFLQRGIRRWLPAGEDDQRGRLLVIKNGRLRPTPLFAVLIAVELSDVMFALDSVPAVLAVTRDPFLAYTSNISAILGLRALYFLVAGALERCWLLHYGLALLLGFMGLKMLLPEAWRPTNLQSLVVIVILVLGSIVGSWLIKPKPASMAKG